MNGSITRRRASAAALLAVALVATGLTLSTPSASATLAESDTFVGWTASTTGSPQPTFALTADTDVVHDGASSLRVDYETASSTTRYVDLRQNVRAAGGVSYSFSAWVRTEGLTQASDAYFVLSGDHSVRKELPTDAHDWTKIEWSYTQPVNSMTFVQRLLVRGPGTIWVDDIRMTVPGSTDNLLINGSFEQHGPAPDTLRFSDTALVYTTGDAEVGLVSYADEISWDIRASSGQRIDSDVAPVAGDGTAAIDLSAYPAGHYSLTATVTSPVALTRTVSLAIVDPPSVEHDAQDPSTSHVGVAVHVNRYSVDQVSALLDPLNAGSVREGPSWDTVETAPGVYTWPALYDQQIAASVARGERPLVILAYSSRFHDSGKTPSSPEGIQAFRDYAFAAAQHFGDDVDYEIYNEFNHTFNNGACGTTADCYLPLLAAAADAVHEGAPGARVVGPVLAGDDLAWMERLFELGGLEHLDVVSYHTYDFPNAPEGRTADRIDEVRGLIDEYAPAGKQIPIWLTEHGWTTTTGNTTEQQQSAYIVRSAVLLQEAGVERVWYYEAIDSGVNPAETEHNFGIARLPKDGGTALTPKPSYSALATYNRLTGDRELMSVERPAGAIVATYGAGADTVRVAWATGAPVTLRTAVGGRADVVKSDGRSWRLRANGPAEITIGGDPVYLVGATGVPSVVADPAVEIQTPDTLALGAAPSVPVSVARASLNVVGSVQAVGPVGAGVTFDADEVTLGLAAFQERGRHPVAYTVRSGGSVVAFVDDSTTVVDNPTFSLSPSPGEGGNVGADLMMRSIEGASDASVSELRYRIGDTSGAFPDAVVAAGEEVALTTDTTALEPWRPYDYSVSAKVDGVARSIAGSTALAPVVAEPSEAPQVDWRLFGTYTAFSGGAADSADLGGTFSLSWSPTGLRVHTDVVDDDHTVAASDDRLWAGDSLQFAVASGLPGLNPGTRAEFGAYLGANGPAVHRFTSPVGAVPEADVDVVRSGNTTTYDVVVPWTELGIDPEDGVFSFSVLVNDNDGGTRQGYYGWGDGIGSSKNSSLFLPVALTSAPAPARAAAIDVDGTPLAGFDPGVTAYRIEALAGGPLPQISATADSDDAVVAITQAPTAPGKATVRVTAEGRPTTVYEIDVARVVGADAAVEATITSVCNGGVAGWSVTATNTSSYAEDIRVTSSFDDQRQAAVAPGSATGFTLLSNAASLPSGTATVAAYVPFAAPARAASYVRHEVDVTAIDCTTP